MVNMTTEPTPDIAVNPHPFVKPRAGKIRQFLTKGVGVTGAASTVFTAVVLHHGMRVDKQPDIPLSMIFAAQQVLGADAPVTDEVQAMSVLQDTHRTQPHKISARYDALAWHVIWQCGFWSIGNCAPEIRAETAALSDAYVPSDAYSAWRGARLDKVIDTINQDPYFIQARLSWNTLDTQARAGVMLRVMDAYGQAYGEDGFVGALPEFRVMAMQGATLANFEHMRMPFMRNPVINMDENMLFHSSFVVALDAMLHELEHFMQIYMSDLRLIAEGRAYLDAHGIHDDAIVLGHGFGVVRLPVYQCVDGERHVTPYYWSSPIEQGARQAGAWALKVDTVTMDDVVQADIVLPAPMPTGERIAPPPKPKAFC